MSNLAYLFIALGLSVVLSVAMWLARYRKPKTFMSSIDEFRREMDALGRDPNDPEPKRWSNRPVTKAPPLVPAPEQGDLARKLKEARKLNRAGGRYDDQYLEPDPDHDDHDDHDRDYDRDSDYDHDPER